MNTLCGIEISQEQADRIRDTCENIIQQVEQRRRMYALQRFAEDFADMQRTNPHNRFFGTVLEYLRKYPQIDRSINERINHERQRAQ